MSISISFYNRNVAKIGSKFVHSSSSCRQGSIDGAPELVFGGAQSMKCVRSATLQRVTGALLVI